MTALNYYVYLNLRRTRKSTTAQTQVPVTDFQLLLLIQKCKLCEGEWSGWNHTFRNYGRKTNKSNNFLWRQTLLYGTQISNNVKQSKTLKVKDGICKSKYPCSVVFCRQMLMMNGNYYISHVGQVLRHFFPTHNLFRTYN